MTAPGLPAQVVEFVREHIRAVEHLEILLLLRAQPNQTWTAQRVCNELRSGVSSVIRRLDALVESGLVAVEQIEEGETVYRFAPKNAGLEADVAMVADAYASHRYAVIETIFSRPSDLLQGFASAFRFRKDKKDG